MSNPLRVALVYNLRQAPPAPERPEDRYSEWDSPQTIRAIADALRQLGCEVWLAEATPSLVTLLTRTRLDLVFNIAEGFGQPSREAQVPALLDFLKIPYTGSGVLTMALALNKAVTKRLLMQAGIPTPKFQLFESPDAPLDERLVFPLITKPNREGSAKGITVESVVHDEGNLRERLALVRHRYEQEVLVEEFIEGRELTVGVLGSGNRAHALPILEFDFAPCAPAGEYFYSWRVKEYQGNAALHLVPRLVCPAPLDDATTRAIQALAVRVHQTVGCVDWSRVDIRLSPDGIPYVLEVNPLPGLHPSDSNFPVMAQQAGLDYLGLIKAIVTSACRRSGLPLPASIASSAKPVTEPEFVAVRRPSDPPEPKERRWTVTAS